MKKIKGNKKGKNVYKFLFLIFASYSSVLLGRLAARSLASDKQKPLSELWTAITGKQFPFRGLTTPAEDINYILHPYVQNFAA